MAAGSTPPPSGSTVELRAAPTGTRCCCWRWSGCCGCGSRRTRRDGPGLAAAGEPLSAQRASAARVGRRSGRLQSRLALENGQLPRGGGRKTNRSFDPPNRARILHRQVGNRVICRPRASLRRAAVCGRKPESGPIYGRTPFISFTFTFMGSCARWRRGKWRPWAVAQTGFRRPRGSWLIGRIFPRH